MKFLIIAMYDGAWEWSILSSLGNVTKDDIYKKELNPLIATIATHLDNDMACYYNDLKDFIDPILINFDFVLVCENGRLHVLRDEQKMFGEIE